MNIKQYGEVTLWATVLFVGLICSSRYIYGMDFSFIVPVLAVPFILVLLVTFLATIIDILYTLATQKS